MESLLVIRLKDFMITDVVSIKIHDTMVEAYEKMNTYGIRHLPVLNNEGEVVGIFTQTDLNHVCPPQETESGWHYSKSILSGFRLEHFIQKNPKTLGEDESLGSAAAIMAQTKIGCIPVVRPGTKIMTGIVTYVDVLKQIAKILP